MGTNNISVALCTYNGAEYIKEELESIFQQTLVPGEVIICDDGSTDNTIEIIQNFKEDKNVNIQLIKNEKRLGIKKNFEKALGLCSYDIIFLADQDDLWKPDKVEKVVKYFESHPDKNVVFTNAVMLNSKSKGEETIWDEVGFTGIQKEKLQDPLLLLSHLFLKRNLATGATMALRKKVLSQYLPLATFITYLHDYLITLQAAASGSLGFIDECLIFYRLHKNQKLGFNRNVPRYMKPLHYLYYGSKKRLTSNKNRREKNTLAEYLKKFTTADFPGAKNFLDDFTK